MAGHTPSAEPAQARPRARQLTAEQAAESVAALSVPDLIRATRYLATNHEEFARVLLQFLEREIGGAQA